MRLLLVEDNARLRASVGEVLRHARHLLDCVATVAEFRSAASQVDYDLFIIDLGLPDGSGLELIRELRSAGCTSPVLVITAHTAIDTRVSGLDSGADDFLVKPFHQAELLARVRALLRRPRLISSPTMQAGSLVVNETTGEVRASGDDVELRPQEWRLLTVLMRRAGTTVPKSAIEAACSEFDHQLSPNAIEVLVCRLRKVLGERDTGVVIETVRGIGYALKEIER
jgi:two-component system response regulator QseB/two-component system response regulator TctD